MDGSIRRLAVVAASAALALPSASPAQELGLDLTDSTDYRPSLAIVGLAPVDPSVPQDTGEKLKVDKVSEAVVAAAGQLNIYSSVLPPADAFGRLEDGYFDALKCADVACFGRVALELDVNQVALGQLVQVGGQTVMRVQSFTRYANSLETIDVPTGRGAKEFERAAVAAFQSALKKGGGSLGILKIASGTQGATARLGPHPLGPVPTSKHVPPGVYTLKVEAAGHLADDIDLQVKPGETLQVESNLMPKAEGVPAASAPVTEAPPEVSAPAAVKGTPLFARPGLYVAAAGAAAVVAGALLGSSAKAIEARAQDGNGDNVLDITRREASTARTHAMLANALVGAGAAALVGGGVWVLFTPSGSTRPSDSPLDPDSEPVGGIGLPDGFMVGISGTLP